MLYMFNHSGRANPSLSVLDRILFSIGGLVMSWDVSLVDASGSAVEVPRHNDGTTQCINADGTAGTSWASMGVTYNYGRHFPFGELHGKRAADTLIMLAEAVKSLGTERNPDYWAPTPGNAGYACFVLFQWGALYPNAVREVH